MFWSRVTNKPGNMPYVREKGEDIAVLNAVEAITSQVLDQRRSNESSESLQGLHQTLQEILAFVTRIKDASYIRRIFFRNTGER